jgi:glyoxylase-like metal-dependent hydrolase (beta-lactamase superfamily II)
MNFMPKLRSASVLLAASLAVLALSSGCSSAPRKIEKPAASQSYTASEAGFLVNSHLITSGNEALLVDAQFLRSDARKVIEMVKASGKQLKAIFITSPHPDHYLGLELISQAFPHTMIYSTEEIINDIERTAKPAIAYWKGIYKEDLADSFILPVPVGANEIELGSQQIQIIKMAEGQSSHSAALYIPNLETLVSGDLVYNQVHLWLVDDMPLSWLRNLKDIREIGIIDTILPGHGPNGDKHLLETDEHYLEAYINATRSPSTRLQAATDMKERYPDWALPIIIDMSVAKRVKH